jgi:hypothetical protein
MVRHDAEPEESPVLAVKTPDFGGEKISSIRNVKDMTSGGGARCQKRQGAWMGVGLFIEANRFATRFSRWHGGRIPGGFQYGTGSISLGRG